MNEKSKRFSQPVRFRHFDHKAYSVFRSLKREVNIGVLAVSMLTFAATTEATAQTTQQPERDQAYELEEVEVTALRAPLTVSQSARMVTVIDRKQLESAPVRTVNELLKYTIGVDVRQRGVQGTQTDISIRGGTFDQITILLNGINICDPQTGHNAADFPVDMNDIERIEILEGPAARVYGTSSLLGAINIVTRTPQDNQVEVHAAGGSYGTAQGGARIQLKQNAFHHAFSGSYNRTDGYSRNVAGTLNSDNQMARAFYQGGYTHTDVDLNWQAGYSDKGYGANTFYSARYDDQYEQTRKYFAAAQATTKGVIQFRPQLYFTRGEDRFELIRGSEERVKYNYHQTDVFGMNLNTSFTSILGKTAIGGEMRNEAIRSTALGEPLTTPKPISGSDREYTLGLNRTNVSFHLEHNVILNHFTLSAGLIATKNTGNEDGFRFYPGVDVSYRMSNHWKLYASWNNSLRLPTFTELYYTTNETHQGNKELKAEEVQAFEGGIKYGTPAIQVALSIYHHRGKNMIDWVQKEGETIWKSINHTRINSTGVELSTTINFRELLHENSFLRRLTVGYSYIDQRKEELPGYVSQYALEYLKHKVVAQLDHRIWKNLEANWSFRWQEREGSYNAYESGVATGVAYYRPFALVDAKLSWNAPTYKIYVEANNLLNRNYYDYGNIPQPGFWIMAGASYCFRW
ncbi:MAG: TonB-dependent receptor plug domain-containing protein [Phocaeicola sp.]